MTRAAWGMVFGTIGSAIGFYVVDAAHGEHEDAGTRYGDLPEYARRELRGDERTNSEAQRLRHSDRRRCCACSSWRPAGRACRSSTPRPSRPSPTAPSAASSAGRKARARSWDASVEVINVETGERQQETTSSTGGFTFKLKPGKYRVELTLHEGESMVKQPGVIDLNKSDVDAHADFVLGVAPHLAPSTAVDTQRPTPASALRSPELRHRPAFDILPGMPDPDVTDAQDPAPVRRRVRLRSARPSSACGGSAASSADRRHLPSRSTAPRCTHSTGSLSPST